jgi:hypothetical protein
LKERIATQINSLAPLGGEQGNQRTSHSGSGQMGASGKGHKSNLARPLAADILVFLLKLNQFSKNIPAIY